MEIKGIGESDHGNKLLMGIQMTVDIKLNVERKKEIIWHKCLTDYWFKWNEQTRRRIVNIFEMCRIEWWIYVTEMLIVIVVVRFSFSNNAVIFGNVIFQS